MPAESLPQNLFAGIEDLDVMGIFDKEAKTACSESFQKLNEKLLEVASLNPAGPAELSRSYFDYATEEGGRCRMTFWQVPAGQTRQSEARIIINDEAEVEDGASLIMQDYVIRPASLFITGAKHLLERSGNERWTIVPDTPPFIQYEADRLKFYQGQNYALPDWREPAHPYDECGYITQKNLADTLYVVLQSFNEVTRKEHTQFTPVGYKLK